MASNEADSTKCLKTFDKTSWCGCQEQKEH